MELQGSPNWSSFLQPVLDAYNKTKHTSTGVAPNDVNSKNELQVAMKMKKKAKVGSYPDVNEGDNVRLQVVHKTLKGSNNNGVQIYTKFRMITIMECTRLMGTCIPGRSCS